MYKLLCLNAISLMSAFSVYASSCGELIAMEERLSCYDTLALCSSVETDAKRLACFESENRPKQQAMQQVPKTAHQTTPQVTSENFIESHISDTRLNRSEVLHIFLENGQVWKEITRSRFRYKKGQKVTITANNRGSDRLHAEGMKKYAKVSQVK